MDIDNYLIKVRPPKDETHIEAYTTGETKSKYIENIKSTGLVSTSGDGTDGFSKKVNSWLGSPQGNSNVGILGGAIGSVGELVVNDIALASSRGGNSGAESSFLVPGKAGFHEFNLLTNVKPRHGFYTGWNRGGNLEKFDLPSLPAKDPQNKSIERIDAFNTITDKYLKGVKEKDIHAFMNLVNPLSKNQFEFVINGNTNDELDFRLKNIKIPDTSKYSSNINYGHSSISLTHGNLIPEKSFTVDVMLDERIKPLKESSGITILENLLKMFGYIKDKDGWWDLNTIGSFNPPVYDWAYLKVLPGFNFNPKYLLKTSGENRTVKMYNSMTFDTNYSTSENVDMWGDKKPIAHDIMPVIYFNGIRVASFDPSFSFNTKTKDPKSIKVTFTYKHVYFRNTKTIKHSVNS